MCFCCFCCCCMFHHCSILLGTGIILMHFAGMEAMRSSQAMQMMNLPMVISSFPLAWVAAAVVLFFLFHMHGFRRRMAASIVIGVAANLVHYFGFFAGAFVALPPEEPVVTSEYIVQAEVACIVSALLSSLARFVFMGMISATND